MTFLVRPTLPLDRLSRLDTFLLGRMVSLFRFMLRCDRLSRLDRRVLSSDRSSRLDALILGISGRVLKLSNETSGPNIAELVPVAFLMRLTERKTAMAMKIKRLFVTGESKRMVIDLARHLFIVGQNEL